MSGVLARHVDISSDYLFVELYEMYPETAAPPVTGSVPSIREAIVTLELSERTTGCHAFLVSSQNDPYMKSRQRSHICCLNEGVCCYYRRKERVMRVVHKDYVDWTCALAILPRVPRLSDMVLLMDIRPVENFLTTNMCAVSMHLGLVK